MLESNLYTTMLGRIHDLFSSKFTALAAIVLTVGAVGITVFASQQKQVGGSNAAISGPCNITYPSIGQTFYGNVPFSWGPAHFSNNGRQQYYFLQISPTTSGSAKIMYYSIPSNHTYFTVPYSDFINHPSPTHTYYVSLSAWDNGWVLGHIGHADEICTSSPAAYLWGIHFYPPNLLPLPAQNPCLKAHAGAGAYCGGQAGNTGYANTLYTCSGACNGHRSCQTTRITSCAYGCQPGGYNRRDYCKPAPRSRGPRAF